MAAATLTVGSDLFSRERRAPVKQFLQRIPANLSTVFWAKLSFFVLSLAGSLVFGFLLAAVMTWLSGDTLPRALKGPDRDFPLQLALFVAFASWVFAISTWVRTSVMAVPTTLVLAAVLVFVGALPFFLLNLLPSFPFDPPAFFWFVAGMGLISARVSFVNSAKRSNPGRSAALSCLGLAFLSFLPVYGSLAVSIVEALDRFHIIEVAAIGENSRFAFIGVKQRSLFRQDQIYFPNATQDDKEHVREKSAYVFPSVLRLDLETGEREFIGTRRMTTIESSRGRPIASVLEHQLVEVIDLLPTNKKGGARGRQLGLVSTYYDLGSGEPSELTREQVHAGFGLGPNDFGVESFPGVPEIYPSGFGSCASLLETSMSMPTYYRTADGHKTMATEHVGIGTVRVLPDGFLVRKERRWHLHDPETGDDVVPKGIERGDLILALLSDGSLFVLSPNRDLLIVDPSLTLRRPIKIPPNRSHAPIQEVRFHQSENRDRIPIDISKPLVVAIGEREWSLAQIDFSKAELTRTEIQIGTNPFFVRSSPSEAVLVESNTQLVRHNLERAERTVLFDASEL